MSGKPRVLVIGMGGTIGSARAADGTHRVLTGAAEIAASLEEHFTGIRIESIDLCQKASRDINLDDIHRVAACIADRADDFEGFLVTHGTDTLEETAYGISLQVSPRKSIALTGAMRPIDAPGGDGPANVAAAMTTVLNPLMERVGPVVVVQDEIHLARWVRKTHTTRAAAFESPGAGPIGYVVEGRVEVMSLPVSSDYLGLPDDLESVRVPLLWVTPGIDGAALEVLASGADGVVIAGTGGGHVSADVAAAVRRLAERDVPVVIASRTGSGPLLRATYGGPGSEVDLRAAGAISAGALHPTKARLRMMVALALGVQLEAAFGSATTCALIETRAR